MEKDKYPLVSIIIPCYNNSKYISAAIDSALNQTYPNKEVIVIDDGSTDGSLDVIKTFSSRIKWRTGFNKGACSARNKGLQIAQGTLIKFLDGDDVLETSSIEAQVRIFNHIKDPDVIVFGKHITVNESSEFISNSTNLSHYNEHDDQMPLLFEKSPILASALYSYNQLQKINGFDNEVLKYQDTDLNIRLRMTGFKFFFHDDLVFYHRKHDSQSRISRRQGSQYIINNSQVLKKWRNYALTYYIDESNASFLEIENKLIYFQLLLARKLFRNHDRKEAIELFRRSFPLNRGLFSKNIPFLYSIMVYILGFTITEKVVSLIRKEL